MEINDSNLTLSMHSPFILMAHCKCLTVTADTDIEIGTVVKDYVGAVKDHKTQLVFYNGYPIKWNGRTYEVISQDDIIATVHHRKN